MDFMKWLSSFDGLLYEVMSWLIFFPLTLWRTLMRPISTMAYADRQLLLPAEEQYSDAMSPPLFLAVALLISGGLAMALGESNGLVQDQHGLSALIKDDATALVLRVLLFATFPLVTAVMSVRGRGLPLDRQTLRAPFYAQSYPTAVFTLALSLGVSLDALPNAVDATRLAGVALALAAFAYYLVVETRWFAAQFGTGYLRGFGAALFALLMGSLMFFAVGSLFVV